MDQFWPFEIKTAAISLDADGEVVAAVSGKYICVTFISLRIITEFPFKEATPF